MADREKCIKGLECCLQTDDVTECQIIDCPYHHWRDTCTEWLMKDAFELLKWQEEETTFIEDKYYGPMCEKCGFHPFAVYIPTIKWMKQRGYKRCPHCGRKVKWDE